MRLFHKAAEWADVRAQRALANIYYQGVGHIAPSPSKAQKWAEKATEEQGDQQAQSILAALTEDHDAVRSYDLDSLAAFQGYFQGRYNLANNYSQRGKRAHRLEDEDLIMKNYLLSMYWFGKAPEIEHHNVGTCQALFFVVQIMQMMIDK
jgi:hypothetical protein